MAWMKASGRGWIPGLGGISTAPNPFSLNMASRASMIATIDKSSVSTSWRDK
jgi:hypothetical protein